MVKYPLNGVKNSLKILKKQVTLNLKGTGRRMEV
jgi:hypothetical protein